MHNFVIDGNMAYNIIQAKWLWENGKLRMFSEHLYDVLITPRGHFAVDRTSSRHNAGVVYETSASHKPRRRQIRVAPTYVVKTTEEFRSMKPARRNCHFPDEVPMHYFPEYSESNCILECYWRKAAGRCGCVPWFVKKAFPESPLCDVFGNICFKHMVDNRRVNLRKIFKLKYS